MITFSRLVAILGLAICVAGIVIDNVAVMLGGAFVGLAALVSSFRR